jgi:hypothetical protein
MEFKGRSLGSFDQILVISHSVEGFRNLCQSMETQTYDDRLVWVNGLNYKKILGGNNSPRVLDWMVNIELFHPEFMGRLESRHPIWVTYQEVSVALRVDRAEKDSFFKGIIPINNVQITNRPSTF